MASVFLDDGSATGTAPIGTGRVRVLQRVNTPDYTSIGWTVIDGQALVALQASEPSPAKWKISGGTLVEMSASEKAQVQAPLDAAAAAVAAAQAQDDARRALAEAQADMVGGIADGTHPITTQAQAVDAIRVLAKVIVFVLRASLRKSAP